MHIVFRLNELQYVIALMATSHADKTSAPDGFYAGNLLGKKQILPTTNKNQHLALKSRSKIVVYRGERYPLLKDGGFDVLNKIAEGDVQKLHIVSYNTSQPQMKWWETSVDFINRATEQELLVWITNIKTVSANETAALVNAVNRLNIKPISLGTDSYKRLYSQGETWKLPLYKRLFEFIENQA